MNNNDVFKKLRVALQLRDDQIIEILNLVDFRIAKAELAAFFRAEDSPNYMECGDQVLRNFLNGLIIHLRGTKENPTNAADVIAKNNEALKQPRTAADKPAGKPSAPRPKSNNPAKKGPSQNKKFDKAKKPAPVVENVKFNNGKNKKG